MRRDETTSPEGGRRLLAVLLAALGTAMATASLLGPLGLEVMVYRTSPTTLNQLLGSDAAALVVAAPLALLAAALVARRHPAGPVLATGVAVYALYTYAQVVVGQEYLRIEGNVERFFPLLLAVFVLGEGCLVLAWRRLPALPVLGRRLERTIGAVLLAVALFLTAALHVPGVLTAWSDPGSMTEYASAPTPFWMVKLMDLGIVVPVAVATGAGLLAGRSWARRVLYPLLTGYAVLSVSVLAMAVVMRVQDDPDASWAMVVGFGGFAVALLVLAGAAYRPLLAAGTPGEPDDPGVRLDVHLEEWGEHSWWRAMANTLTNSHGSAQFRFVARPAGESRPSPRWVVGATFPVLRLQDLGDDTAPNAWLEVAHERLAELDAELRRTGWTPVPGDGRHWWSRSYVPG